MEKKSVLENKDYSYLVGKEFKILGVRKFDVIGIGVVKRFEYRSGITISFKHDMGYNIIFLDNPKSLSYSYSNLGRSGNYKGAFTCLTRKIKKGLLDPNVTLAYPFWTI